MRANTVARALGTALTILLAATYAGPARAGDAVTRAAAAAAYDRASAAFEKGRYAEAAAGFADADALAPSSAALEAAIKAAVLASDAPLAMTLAERADARPADASLARAALDARAKLAGRAGKITIGCAAPCEATVGGAAVPVGEKRWVPSGDHVVAITSGGHVERYAVHVDAGADVAWQPPAPAAPAPAPQAVAVAKAPSPAAPVAPVAPVSPVAPGAPVTPAETRDGLSPAWFWIGAGATAVLGGASVVSGLDTSSKHDDFESLQTEGSRSDGMAAQTRTNVLLGATGVMALATVAVGWFGVQWSGRATGASGGPTLALAPPCGPGAPLAGASAILRY